MSWFFGTPVPYISTPSLPPSVRIQSEQIDQTLRIEWKHKVADLENQTLTFSGGVKAYYGETTLTAETLVLHLKPGEEKGIADGGVMIEDPEGMIRARHFEFSWTAETGVADDVEVHIDRLLIKAQKIDVKPTIWTLSKVSVMPCPDEPGRITIQGDSIVVQIGKKAVAKHVSWNVFGRKLATFPTQTFSLDKRSGGIQWPSLSYRPGTGPGVTWSSDLGIAPNTFAAASFSAFNGRRPRTDFMISQDLLRGGSERTVRPASELGDPFSHSFLDNVSVKTPESDHKHLASRIFTAGIGSAWNLTPGGSEGGGRISKPWDMAVETGGLVGPFAVVGQLRYQRIGENGHDYRNRAIFSGSLGLPNYEIAPKLQTLVRFDGRAYFEDGQFAWLRGLTGLTWNPTKNIRLSGGRTFTIETGTPAFNFDDLDRKHSWVGRVDLDLGPTKISLLGKYDSARSSLYDREVYLSQIAGCFEPFIVYRQEPRRFGFGIQFRPFDILERLKERTLKRQEKTPETSPLVVIGK